MLWWFMMLMYTFVKVYILQKPFRIKLYTVFILADYQIFWKGKKIIYSFFFKTICSHYKSTPTLQAKKYNGKCLNITE